MARAARARDADAIAGENAGVLLMRSAPAGRPGQGPEGRHRVPIRSAVEALVAVWRQWNAVDGSRLAAALAFYSMLSLAPFLILLVAVAAGGSDRTRPPITSRHASPI